MRKQGKIHSLSKLSCQPCCLICFVILEFATHFCEPACEIWIEIHNAFKWKRCYSDFVSELTHWTVSYVSRKEIGQILNSSYLRGLNMASFFASSKITVFFTFTVYALLGNPITARSVFVTVSLYGTIKLTVTLFFPLAIEKLSETVVSIRRIKVIFLSLSDNCGISRLSESW